MKIKDVHPNAVTGIVIFLLGICGGLLIARFIPAPVGGDHEVLAGYNGLTNPLLECNIGAKTLTAHKTNFKNQLEAFVNDMNANDPNVNDIGVYYRDLNNGPVIGVNQDEPFLPASLLKLPVMMAYYSWSEREPGILQRSVVFQKDPNLPVNPAVPPARQPVSGQKYTYEQLIEYMIQYSDNGALETLYKDLPSQDSEQLYTMLGMDPHILTSPEETLSANKYSTFFRLLFNASYLTRADSEKALQVLEKSAYLDGLRAGVPANIPIAHKFGEREIGAGLQQLHDCGIIYYPKSPYLLCVMTKGKDVKSLSKAISRISDFVYAHVTEQQ